MRVALYTTGIGAGHLSRALAIARGLARGGVRAELRVFYGRFSGTPPPGLNVTSLPSSRAELDDPRLAKDSAVARALTEYAPELLVVDLSWFDLKHVLPLPGTEVWLLLRWVPPQFLRGPMNHGYDPAHYARVIGIEPIAPAEASERIDPIVVCNPDECLPRAALRERFGVPEGERISFVVQAGLPGECEELVRYEHERDAGFRVLSANLHEGPPLFPVAPYLPGADRIVGGAGYNLFWETRFLGLEARTELHVFRRAGDDQTPRLRSPRHVFRENGADTLARLVQNGSW